jgi:hypothetical protein
LILLEIATFPDRHSPWRCKFRRNTSGGNRSSSRYGVAPPRSLEDDMAQPPTFEIPQQLRELTERNVEHARAAYGQFMDAVTQAMGVWASAAPPNLMTSSFKVVQDRAVKFAKQNAEACFSLASELANAKDVTDVLGIQSRHAQTQMQAYTLQAQELTRLMMEAAQQGMQQPR